MSLPDSARLRVKTHRPPVPTDGVSRKRLERILDLAETKTVTLVSAGAGYGKSTLVSSWLEGRAGRSVWMNLDEGDRDLRTFLHYLVMAINAVFPVSLHETQALIEPATLPSIPTIAGMLNNDLDDLEDPLILVLDDVHHVKDGPVRDFLSELLSLPAPRQCSLVLIGREIPALPLTRLRAAGHVNEIHTADLAFTVEETQAFLGNLTGSDPSPETAERWRRGAEGWPTGLRLAALGLRFREQLELPDPFEAIRERDHALQYLLHEVLAEQDPATLSYLLRTSVAQRFNADLCDSLQEPSVALSGRKFLEIISKRNLFLIPLDHDGEWFRFHDLFRELLLREAERRKGAEAMAALRRRAVVWLEAHGMVEEAIALNREARDLEGAADVMERNRMRPIQEDKPYVIRSWLDQLPESIINRRLELLKGRLWTLNERLDGDTMGAVLDRAEALRGKLGETAFSGEIELFRGRWLVYQGRQDEAFAHLEAALEHIPGSDFQVRAWGEVFYLMAAMMLGRYEEATAKVQEWLDQDPDPHPARQCLVFGSRAAIEIANANFERAKQYCKHFRSIAQQHNLNNIKAWADYLTGVIHLTRNELSEAELYLSRVLAQRYHYDEDGASDGMAALMVTRLGLGRFKAAETVLSYIRELFEGAEPRVAAFADSCEARFHLLRGDPREPLEWGMQSAGNLGALLFYTEVPRITHAKALIAKGNPVHLREAVEHLNSIEQGCRDQYNVYQLIATLAPKAVAYWKLEDPTAAAAAVSEAVSLAEPGGGVFPFVEAGSPMVEVLRALAETGRETTFVKELIRAVSESVFVQEPEHRAKPPQPLPTPLTPRELEVLRLLSRGLYQREVAEQLEISPETVKSHVKKIYEKLGVSHRRRAVEEGFALGLI